MRSFGLALLFVALPLLASAEPESQRRARAQREAIERNKNKRSNLKAAANRRAEERAAQRKSNADFIDSLRESERRRRAAEAEKADRRREAFARDQARRYDFSIVSECDKSDGSMCLCAMGLRQAAKACGRSGPLRHSSECSHYEGQLKSRFGESWLKTTERRCKTSSPRFGDASRLEQAQRQERIERDLSDCRRNKDFKACDRVTQTKPGPYRLYEEYMVQAAQIACYHRKSDCGRAERLEKKYKMKRSAAERKKLVENLLQDDDCLVRNRAVACLEAARRRTGKRGERARPYLENGCRRGTPASVRPRLCALQSDLLGQLCVHADGYKRADEICPEFLRAADEAGAQRVYDEAQRSGLLGAFKSRIGAKSHRAKDGKTRARLLALHKSAIDYLCFDGRGQSLEARWFACTDLTGRGVGKAALRLQEIADLSAKDRRVRTKVATYRKTKAAKEMRRLRKTKAVTEFHRSAENEALAERFGKDCRDGKKDCAATDESVRGPIEERPFFDRCSKRGDDMKEQFRACIELALLRLERDGSFEFADVIGNNVSTFNNLLVDHSRRPLKNRKARRRRDAQLKKIKEKVNERLCNRGKARACRVWSQTTRDDKEELRRQIIGCKIEGQAAGASYMANCESALLNALKLSEPTDFLNAISDPRQRAVIELKMQRKWQKKRLEKNPPRRADRKIQRRRAKASCEAGTAWACETWFQLADTGPVRLQARGALCAVTVKSNHPLAQTVCAEAVREATLQNEEPNFLNALKPKAREVVRKQGVRMAAIDKKKLRERLAKCEARASRCDWASRIAPNLQMSFELMKKACLHPEQSESSQRRSCKEAVRLAELLDIKPDFVPSTVKL